MKKVNEVWKDIPGWEGVYQVSITGRVKRLPGLSIDGKRRLKGKLLTPHFFSEEYKSAYVHLGNSSYHYMESIARLMLITFVGTPDTGEECCHRDDNPENNWLDNLYWGTKIQNRKDFVRNGKSPKGERNAGAKLTEEQVKYIRENCVPYKRSNSTRVMAERFGVKPWTITMLLKRKQWAHV